MISNREQFCLLYTFRREYRAERVSSLAEWQQSSASVLVSDLFICAEINGSRTG